MRKIMGAAHRMTKEIKAEYPEVDYRAQLGLCLAYIIKIERVYQMELKNLIGTEKQVAWAQDIRDGYLKRAEELKEAEDVLRDLTVKEIVAEDPLRGQKRTMKRYARELTSGQQATIYSVSQFCPREGSDQAPEITWKANRAKEIGGEHAGRLAEADYIAMLIASIEKAVETETDAKYWINNR